MTCKDCYHYNVCAMNGIDVENTTFKKELCCGEFKDKTSIVELPKIIWVISEYLELEEYEVLGVFTTNNSIWLDTKGNKQQLLMPISYYNKAWFTDKTKAEAILKSKIEERLNE